MASIHRVFLLIAASIVLGACVPAGKPDQKSSNEMAGHNRRPSDAGGSALGAALASPTKYHFKYSLQSVGGGLRLSRALKEISGLSLSADGAHLLAVNDEEGKVFFLDKTRGRILRELPFGEGGDYEGLEVVGHTIYIARSDGVIFEVEHVGKAAPAVSIHRTVLNVDYDVEGLAYDRANHRLLLACKGIAGRGSAYENKRAVFTFSLDSMQLSEAPVYLLSADMPVAEAAIREAWWPDVLEGKFAPSGIAVHPVTGHIYILSSKGKGRSVLVLSASGELLCIRELDKNPFNQPEGICFGPDGTMYISTEAKGKRGKGRIFAFRML